MSSGIIRPSWSLRVLQSKGNLYTHIRVLVTVGDRTYISGVGHQKGRGGDDLPLGVFILPTDDVVAVEHTWGARALSLWNPTPHRRAVCRGVLQLTQLLSPPRDSQLFAAISSFWEHQRLYDAQNPHPTLIAMTAELFRAIFDPQFEEAERLATQRLADSSPESGKLRN